MREQTASLPAAGAATGSSFNATDLLLLSMTLIWGTNFTVIKHALADFQPLAFNGLRFTLASVVLAVAARLMGQTFRVPRGDGWKLFGYGLLANAIYQTLFISGMARTRTGNAALILSTTPLFTALVSRFRNQERFTKSGVAGLLLAFVGMILVILKGRGDVDFGATLAGDLMMVAATLCWAVYTVGARRLLDVHGSLKATTLMMVAGTPVFLLFCAPSLAQQDWSAVRPAAWGGLVFSGMLAIALAHFIWNYGVKKIGSTRTAIYSNVTPVVAMLVAWLALGERPTAGQTAGAALLFLGLYFVRRGFQ